MQCVPQYAFGYNFFSKLVVSQCHVLGNACMDFIVLKPWVQAPLCFGAINAIIHPSRP